VHKQVYDAAQSRREKQRKRHLEKRSVHAINFGLGDFVLVAKRDFRVGEKLTLRWRGPKRIVGVLFDFLFEVEDLRNGQSVMCTRNACVSIMMRHLTLRRS
jgi:hypothetical protein